MNHRNRNRMRKLVASVFLMSYLGSALAQNCFNYIEETTPDANFTVYSDGTVSDRTSGLMWTRCSLGQAWNGTSCGGGANTGYYWQDALRAAEKLEYAGYDDWRLPNLKELQTLVEAKCMEPAINSTIFPETPSTWFWTSTAPVNNYDQSETTFIIHFREGTTTLMNKEIVGLATRFVRTDR